MFRCKFQISLRLIKTESRSATMYTHHIQCIMYTYMYMYMYIHLSFFFNSHTDVYTVCTCIHTNVHVHIQSYKSAQSKLQKSKSLDLKSPKDLEGIQTQQRQDITSFDRDALLEVSGQFCRVVS